jgi:hypothetical protein
MNPTGGTAVPTHFTFPQNATLCGEKEGRESWEPSRGRAMEEGPHLMNVGWLLMNVVWLLMNAGLLLEMLAGYYDVGWQYVAS